MARSGPSRRGPAPEALVGLPREGSGRLAYLDQVAVRIPDIAADLILMLFRRSEELGPTRAPLGVDGLDVRDPDVEEAADPIGVGWRFERDGRLVVGGTATHVDDDPLVASATNDGPAALRGLPPRHSGEERGGGSTAVGTEELVRTDPSLRGGESGNSPC